MTKFVTIPKDKMSDEQFASVGVDIADLGIKVGFAKTKSEFRRMVEQKAVRIDDHLICDPFARACMNHGVWVIVERKELEN